MTFTYDVQNDDGDVIETFDVDVTFDDEVSGFFSGRPEKCYPDSGGKIVDLTIYRNNKDVTRFVRDDVYFQIRDYARRRQR